MSFTWFRAVCDGAKCKTWERDHIAWIENLMGGEAKILVSFKREKIKWGGKGKGSVCWLKEEKIKS